MSFYLNFWHQTSVTWINIFTVLVGTSLGLLLRGYLAPNIQTIITQGIGFNLLELVKIRVASFLPALIVSPFIYWLALY